MDEWSDTFSPQKEWGVGRGGWAANSMYLLIALFLGGVGAGASLISLLLERANSDWYFLAGFLVAVVGKGFFHVIFLGNPLRAWRAVSRWQSSWISRGIIALSLFSVAGGLYLLWPIAGVFGEAGAGEERALAITCFTLLGILVVYDGFLLSEAAAIGAWNMALMIILFPVFSLLGGAGLVGALWGPLHTEAPLDIEALHEIETILLAAGAFALAGYLLTIHRDHFLRESAWSMIVGPLRWLFVIAVVGGAVALPLGVSALSLTWSLVEDATALLAIVALIAVIGDFAFKYMVLSVGGYQQQFAPGAGRWSMTPTKFTMEVQPAGQSPGL
jgi:formate-dependent nitrite reductase membrane component NrfD